MGLDALKKPTPPVPPKPVVQPAPVQTAQAPSIPATTTPGSKPASVPTGFTQVSGFVPDDPARTADPLGSGSSLTAPVSDAPVLTQLELQTKSLSGRSTVVPAGQDTDVLPGKKPKDPSAAPENQDVTGEMSAEEKEAYDALNEPDRTAYNEQYRAAKEEGPEAVERLEQVLSEGLAHDYVNLPPAERAEYDALFTAAQESSDPASAMKALNGLLADHQIDEYLTVKSSAGPEEQGQLQELLLDGTLTASEGNDGSMLDYMHEFVKGTPEGSTPKPREVPRGDLIDQIIRDVHDNTVTQPEGDRNCGPLAVLGEFARNNPAGYARALTKLAQDGEVTVHDGQGQPVTLKYEGPPGAVEGPNGERLTLTEQIFVESFARHIDEKFGHDDRGGVFGAIHNFFDLIDGNTALEVAELSELTTGTDYDAMTVPEEDEIDPNDPEAVEKAKKLREEAEETIDEQLEAGEHPTVLIDGHWVRVTDKITMGVPPFAIELYVYDDGSGKPKVSGTNAFMDKVESVVYNSEVSSVPPGSYNSEWDDPGTGSSALPGGGDPGEGRR